MSSPEILRAERWLTFWNILVISGAALTAVATFFAIRYGDKVSFLKDNELAHFQTEAQRDIAQANEKAQDAVRGQKQLEVNAEQARLKQREAERQTAELQLKVEQERVARLKLEEQVADRRVSPEQKEALRTQLVGLGNPNVIIVYIAGSGETAHFSHELQDAFRDAGLTITGSDIMILGGASKGITMMIGVQRLRDAEIVAGALQGAGIVQGQINASRAGEEHPDMLQLTVWPK